VWESLVVNLGYRPSYLFGEEFLSASIHSPLSGLLIGPSTGTPYEPAHALSGGHEAPMPARPPPPALPDAVAVVARDGSPATATPPAASSSSAALSSRTS
jgi:hypothetical protein